MLLYNAFSNLPVQHSEPFSDSNTAISRTRRDPAAPRPHAHAAVERQTQRVAARVELSVQPLLVEIRLIAAQVQDAGDSSAAPRRRRGG